MKITPLAALLSLAACATEQVGDGPPAGDFMPSGTLVVNSTTYSLNGDDRAEVTNQSTLAGIAIALREGPVTVSLTGSVGMDLSPRTGDRAIVVIGVPGQTESTQDATIRLSTATEVDGAVRLAGTFAGDVCKDVFVLPGDALPAPECRRVTGSFDIIAEDRRAEPFYVPS
ncbi:hypothetical protein [Pelagovum pacificum]|uniref:Lipoprotein n=1 Tax=Pelagovum pacificum TaxID=2588711 RepID=A0A5C5GBE0_9RHOB|nr:hypothetical protein [Pelagovum pacificum]QQA41224.1 hypothetical protein I8N54_10310 [Pelagovum pacificum]TNY31968.1 hypothetical protein FHY64_01290 [Pelagovum pacificum]